MKIFDTSILNLPLYEERHRALAADLEVWVAAHQELLQAHAGASASERGRIYTEALGADGWLSYAVDVAHGRERPDLRSLCIIREALAYMDDLMDFAFAIQGLAAAPVAWFGSRRQQADLLPLLRTGEKVGALSLSEPAVGSNLAAAAVEAKRSGDGYRIDGVKTWTSNGTIADYYSVLLRTGEGPGAMGLSFLLIPRSTPGLSTKEIVLMAPRSFSDTRFENCIVPHDALIGDAGMGFRYAMEILNFYRVTVGAAAVGFCRRAMQAATEWARNRNVAGGKLLQTQMTIDKVADMALYLDSASLLVARAAWEFDTGIKEVAAHASMAKLYATDGAAKVADDTVQLFGAAGLVANSVAEQLYRQVRALRIYEGTSEIQKLIIAGAVSRAKS
ncbi:MAG: acyl-CoA dehydrogenase family protein [Sulfurifustaceae bacterium]